ncbi:hypothetical protein BH10PSE12_BH10PSE12_02900 [soil metagenome]
MNAGLAAAARAFRDDLEEEVALAARNRAAAAPFDAMHRRDITPTPDPLSVGAQFQDIAFRDDPLAAASLVRTRWNALWLGICAHAVATGQRPIPAMLDLIEAALDPNETAKSEQAA